MSGGPWSVTTVTEIRDETARSKTYRLRFPAPVPFRPGQHVIIRLTAPDGYTASRAYSIASAPDPQRPDELEVTVELLEGGEVSGFLHEEVVVGDELEVRGPIGGWFVWDGTSPALLLGGGSGVVPLMSMLRTARATASTDRLRMIVSVRSADDLLYATELAGTEPAGTEPAGADPDPTVRVVYTRTAPEGSDRRAGRLTVEDLRAVLPPDAGVTPIAYVCGSAGFADSATRLLEEVGHPADRIRIERYGPSATA